MSPKDILDIIRAFFAAILNVLQALGINFKKATQTDASATDAKA